jgi:hypothetical protein
MSAARDTRRLWRLVLHRSPYTFEKEYAAGRGLTPQFGKVIVFLGVIPSQRLGITGKLRNDEVRNFIGAFKNLPGATARNKNLSPKCRNGLERRPIVSIERRLVMNLHLGDHICCCHAETP